MRIHEILSDLPRLRELRTALKAVIAAPANKFSLKTDLAIGGQKADAVAQAASDAVVNAALNGTNLKAAIRANIRSQIDAIEAKYAGLTIEED